MWGPVLNNYENNYIHDMLYKIIKQFFFSEMGTAKFETI